MEVGIALDIKNTLVIIAITIKVEATIIISGEFFLVDLFKFILFV